MKPDAFCGVIVRHQPCRPIDEIFAQAIPGRAQFLRYPVPSKIVYGLDEPALERIVNTTCKWRRLADAMEPAQRPPEAQ